MAARGLYEITIEDDDGHEYVIKADTRDVLRWERGGEGRNAVLLGSGKFDLIYSLAHVAARRHGLFEDLTLKEFEDRFVIVLAAEITSSTGEADEGGPTSPDRSTET